MQVRYGRICATVAHLVVGQAVGVFLPVIYNYNLFELNSLGKKCAGSAALPDITRRVVDSFRLPAANWMLV